MNHARISSFLPEKAKNKCTTHKLFLHLAGQFDRSSGIYQIPFSCIFPDLYGGPLSPRSSLLVCAVPTSQDVVQVPTSAHLTQEFPVSHDETLHVIFRSQSWNIVILTNSSKIPHPTGPIFISIPDKTPSHHSTRRWLQFVIHQEKTRFP